MSDIKCTACNGIACIKETPNDSWFLDCRNLDCGFTGPNRGARKAAIADAELFKPHAAAPAVDGALLIAAATILAGFCEIDMMRAVQGAIELRDELAKRLAGKK